MNPLLEQMILALELHDVAAIRQCFQQGLLPDATYAGAPLWQELSSQYTRSPRFSNCMQAFVHAGLQLNDACLQAVLTNDAALLQHHLKHDPGQLNQRRYLRCAYTPLHGVSLLHIAAEFNQVACAEVLRENGANLDAEAETDAWGFGGHTPLYHTVNQNNDQSKDMRDWLLANGANPQHSIRGLIWGKGYAWETLIPGVNVLGYATMGLLPQMHRSQYHIAGVVKQLLEQAYGIAFTPPNIPNAYLKG